MLAGLLALIEAHRASAAEGAAAVVLRALGEVAALALRFAAAPGAWRLASVTSSPDAAGLSLAPATPPVRPRLTPAHLALVNSTEMALVRLASAQQAADLLTDDALDLPLPAENPHRVAILENCGELRTALDLLTHALCEAAHELTGSGLDSTPIQCVLDLHDLARVASVDPRAHDAVDARSARAALEHFSRTSRD